MTIWHLKVIAQWHDVLVSRRDPLKDIHLISDLYMEWHEARRRSA